MTAPLQSDSSEKSTQSNVPEPAFPPPLEVEPRALRRRFTTAYKLKVLQLADQCHDHGSLGALLRREGLYSSHLSQWRKLRDQGFFNSFLSSQTPSSSQPGLSLPSDSPFPSLANLSLPAQPDFSDVIKLNQLLTQRNNYLETVVLAQKKLSEAFVLILTPIVPTFPTENYSTIPSKSSLPASV